MTYMSNGMNGNQCIVLEDRGMCPVCAILHMMGLQPDFRRLVVRAAIAHTADIPHAVEP